VETNPGSREGAKARSKLEVALQAALDARAGPPCIGLAAQGERSTLNSEPRLVGAERSTLKVHSSCSSSGDRASLESSA
jgi:hypothetical protein